MMSKFKNFPKLKEGDLVVCGKHNGFLVTDRGAYVLRIPSKVGVQAVEIDGNTSHPTDLLELNTEYPNDFYIPQAVFRPPAGKLIEWYDLMSMLTDYKEYITKDTDYDCVWSQDIDEVKELTVDEVSEKLGYKVKIVGSDK